MSKATLGAVRRSVSSLVARWTTRTCGHSFSRLRGDGRGLVGRGDQRRAYSALVSAGRRRAQTRRPLSVGRQRGRRDHGLRTAVAFRAHVGVRRGRQLGGGTSRGRWSRPREADTLTHTVGATFRSTGVSTAPGATGVGWELGLLGLAVHITQPTEPKPDEATFAASPDGKAFIAGSSQGWAQAAVAAGTEPDVARAAARRTTAFYAGESPDPS